MATTYKKLSYDGKPTMCDVAEKDSAGHTIKDYYTSITNHTSNKSNPHGVTAAQVGLGNVANFFYDTSYTTSEPAEVEYATNLSCYHLYQDLNKKMQTVLEPRNGISMGLIIGSTKNTIGIYLFTTDITVY